jgi:hypothetical protein
LSSEGDVQFAVERRVHGITTLDAAINNRSIGNCAYSFTVGERYVVYAYRDRQTNTLTASICSRTALVSKASSDLEYFDELDQPSTGARVYGRISHVDPNLVTGGITDHGPVSGVTLTLASQSIRTRAITDTAGQFDVRGLAAGEYELQADILPQFVPWRPLVLRLLNDRACHEVNSIVRLNGRIIGRLLDEEGTPAQGVLVEVAAANAKGSDRPPRILNARTDRDGTFEVAPLPPGDYVVGTELSRPPRDGKLDRRRYYPGVRDSEAAQVVHLGAASRVRLDPFQLPAFPTERVIEGVVLWPDGSRAVGATVVLYGAGPEEHVSDDGRFRFVLPYGAQFVLSARSSTMRNGRTVSVQTIPNRIIDREDHDASVELRLKVP